MQVSNNNLLADSKNRNLIVRINKLGSYSYDSSHKNNVNVMNLSYLPVVWDLPAGFFFGEKIRDNLKIR